MAKPASFLQLTLYAKREHRLPACAKTGKMPVLPIWGARIRGNPLSELPKQELWGKCVPKRELGNEIEKLRPTCLCISFSFTDY